MVTEKASQHPASSSRMPVLLPCDLETWPLVQGALTRMRKVSTMSEVIPVMDHIYALIHGGSKIADTKRTSSATVLSGLLHFLENIATKEERALFVDKTFPMIIDLALALGDLKPKEGFFYSLQQIGGEVRLPRRFVASLMAHLFLCTLPAPSSSSSLCDLALNCTHFASFFAVLDMSKGEDSQTAKLRCVLNYFNRLARDYESIGPPGTITFTRKVLARDEMPMLETWKDSRLQLCPLVVRPEGLIEEAGSSTLQVDFANEYIGGGALGSGCVQEEIRFSVCPELLVSLIFMESMEENEALSISGFEQFSSYTGYGWGLRFGGDYRDSAQVTSRGDIKTSLVAIDATCQPGNDQYKDPLLLRELNKAYVGFLQTEMALGTEFSESVYLDAMDQSQMSTEGDFETASEGLESHPRSATPSISTILDYSNSLSRAITDIAVKDYCQGKRDQATQSDPSLESDITDKGESRFGSRNGGLSNLASTIAGNVVREGYVHASKRSTSKRRESPRRHNGPSGDDLPDSAADKLLDETIRSQMSCRRSNDQIIWNGSHRYPVASGDAITPNLSAIIDDIVGGVIKEALAEIAGKCVSETCSTPGPSLEGYSMISTWSSSKSDSFVRIDMDSDFSASGTRSVGSLSSVGSERVGMTVETYVSNVVAGAVQKMCKDGDGDKRGLDSQSTEQTDVNKVAERIVGGVMKQVQERLHQGGEVGSRNSYFKPVVSAGLDAFAAHVTDSAFKDALREVSAPGRNQGFPFTQYSTLPSTPPPSPSNASTGSSKRFSLEDPTQLEEFAEKLLSTITPESSSTRHQRVGNGDISMSRYQEIESFASSLVTRAVTDSTQIASSFSQPRRESSSGCISSRSSLTVPSGSSKRSSMDSFTEDLLRIGNIDPTGRRPSKTEENIAFFSQELTRVAEVEEKLGQRRKSDLDDFQQELCQSSVSSRASQKNEVTQSKVHAASRLANRLSDDIICDAFLQLYGATPFRELIRLDSLSDLDSGGNRRRSYPRRGFRTSSVSSTSLSVRSTISEMDLVTLATNLANTIIESALQTYRDEYLTAQRRQAEMDNTDSQPPDTLDEVSMMATYDGSNLDRLETACTSLAGELPPVLSIQETAGSIVEKAVQDAVALYQASMSSTVGAAQQGTPARRPIATGNWGCGAFGGDPQLKSLLQWVAASQCRAPSLFYYSFQDERVHQLEQVTLKIQTKRWSVGDLIRIIHEYCHLLATSEGSGHGLFDYILGLQC